MSAIDRFLLLARAYRDATGLKTTALSWRLFGDSKKLGAIENGADIQVTRYERALQWFSDNWPADVDWPSEGGGRPSLSPSKAIASATNQEADTPDLDAEVPLTVGCVSNHGARPGATGTQSR